MAEARFNVVAGFKDEASAPIKRMKASVVQDLKGIEQGVPKKLTYPMVLEMQRLAERSDKVSKSVVGGLENIADAARFDTQGLDEAAREFARLKKEMGEGADAAKKLDDVARQLANTTDDKLAEGIEESRKELDKLNKEMKEGQGQTKKHTQELDKGTAAIKRFATGMIAGVASYQAVQRVLVDGVRLFVEHERGQARLENAIRNSTKAGDLSAASLTKQAEALQRLTGVSSDQINKIQAIGLATGVAAHQIDTFTEATINAAIFIDRDFTSTAINLAKTLGGIYGEVGELIPQIKDLSKEALIAGEGIALAGRITAGAAEEMSRAGLRIDALGDSFRDAKEEIGRFTVAVAAAGATVASGTTQQDVSALITLTDTWAGSINSLSSAANKAGGALSKFFDLVPDESPFGPWVEDLLKAQRVLEILGGIQGPGDIVGLAVGQVPGSVRASDQAALEADFKRRVKEWDKRLAAQGFPVQGPALPVDETAAMAAALKSAAAAYNMAEAQQRDGAAIFQSYVGAFDPDEALRRTQELLAAHGTLADAENAVAAELERQALELAKQRGMDALEREAAALADRLGQFEPRTGVTAGLVGGQQPGFTGPQRPVDVDTERIAQEFKDSLRDTARDYKESIKDADALNAKNKAFYEAANAGLGTLEDSMTRLVLTGTTGFDSISDIIASIIRSAGGSITESVFKALVSLIPIPGASAAYNALGPGGYEGYQGPQLPGSSRRDVQIEKLSDSVLALRESIESIKTEQISDARLARAAARVIAPELALAQRRGQ